MESLRLTQQQLAQRSDVSTSTIRKLQHRRPVTQRRKLVALSEALGWPPDAILVMLSGGDPPAEDTYVPPASVQDAVWAKHQRVVDGLMPPVAAVEVLRRIERLEAGVSVLQADLARIAALVEPLDRQGSD